MSLTANMTVEGPQAAGSTTQPQPVLAGYWDGAAVQAQGAPGGAGNSTATGTANISQSQVVTTAAALTLLAARPTRRVAVVVNMDAAITIYVGAATVTTANGFPLKPGQSLDVYWTGLLQVIPASGTPTVGVIDFYN